MAVPCVATRAVTTVKRPPAPRLWRACSALAELGGAWWTLLDSNPLSQKREGDKGELDSIVSAHGELAKQALAEIASIFCAASEQDKAYLLGLARGLRK